MFVAVSMHFPLMVVILWLVFATRDADRQVPFDSACFFNRRVHRDAFIVGDHDHDVLSQVLRPLALQQDVVDVLLLHGDLEPHVLVLQPAAQLEHELAHGLGRILVFVGPHHPIGIYVSTAALFGCRRLYQSLNLGDTFLRQDFQSFKLGRLEGLLNGVPEQVLFHLNDLLFGGSYWSCLLAVKGFRAHLLVLNIVRLPIVFDLFC